MRHSVIGWYVARIAILIVLTASIGCTDALYEITAADPTVRLPLDEAPHEFGAGEWWYYTGHLATEQGDRFGVEAVIFRIPKLPFLANLAQGWMAHFAVLDVSKGTFVFDQTRVFTSATADGSQLAGFDIETPLVRLEGFDGHDRLRAAMSDGSFALDLRLEDEKGVVLHGDAGYVPFGLNGSAFYYSRPRMRATGTLEIDGEPHAVSGQFWFDRQWGLAITNPLLEWDWFSLRLDDGSDVMLFVFRDGGTPVSIGTFAPAAGEPVPLAAEDFVITPTATWTSPHTGITYPVRWDIQILPEELVVQVAAVVNDQELDARATTFNVYWEGLCTVEGTRRGKPVAGHAFVELTNYSR